MSDSFGSRDVVDPSLQETRDGTDAEPAAGTNYQRSTAELYAEAVEVWRASLGEAHPATARGYANLGRAHQALGDDAAALTWLKRGYEVMVDAVGEAHPKASAVRGDLETLCEDDGYAPACAYLGLPAPAPMEEAEPVEASIARAGEPPSAP